MESQQTYEQQIEAGKKFVKGVMEKLATELGQPEINDFSFMVTDRDFDHNQVSILDPKRKKVVMKIKESDLADAPATPVVRRTLEAQLNAAIRTYYKV